MKATYKKKLIKTILTDIEGTTTDINFIREVLFPYSAKRLSDWVYNHLEMQIVRDILQKVREISDQPNLNLENCLSQLIAWHAEDRKITPLKTLQGLIWQEGYSRGEIKAHLYPDAIEYLQNWYSTGLTLAVFSSGSITAQKLLFRNTLTGDLNSLFSMYFDTNIGSKIESKSYSVIAHELSVLPQEILFLSDSSKELAAANAAKLNVCGLNRQNTTVTNNCMYVEDFSQIPLKFYEN